MGYVLCNVWKKLWELSMSNYIQSGLEWFSSPYVIRHIYRYMLYLYRKKTYANDICLTTSENVLQLDTVARA